jgi:4-diphosphocytidyl-2-C-methyl-D-erythritol kinase
MPLFCERKRVPTLLAPAKINATLEILSRRDDGYHTLRSVMLPIALYDRIELNPSAAPAFAASDPTLANDNLVMRALAAAGAESRFDAMLHKTIPVGGGLGGGSSDAAAVLRAAMEGELGDVAETDWLAAARSIGSDVPFFLAGTGALVEGTGERVTAIGTLPDWWVVVARPHAFVPTADAYRLLDGARALPGGEMPSRPRATSASLAVVDALQRRDFDAFGASLVNDFHDVILAAFPDVARTDAALRAAGAAHVLLSGSGSCLFAAFENEAGAREVAARVAPDACEALFTVPLHHDRAWR